MAIIKHQPIPSIKYEDAVCSCGQGFHDGENANGIELG